MRSWVILQGIGGLVCGSLLLGAQIRAVNPVNRPSVPAWGVDLSGKPLEKLAPKGERVVVLFFVATDCPVSNRSFPEMQRLRAEFTAQGVRFWFVYPNTTEHAAEILTHQRAFAGDGQALQDPAGTLVRLSRAVATPEAVVLLSDTTGWRPVYAGRVDDRFVRLGVERPMITRHFIEEALRAVLAGRAPAPAEGSPVGCAILNPGVR